MNTSHPTELDQFSVPEISKNKSSEGVPFIDSSKPFHCDITKDTDPPSNWQCIAVMTMDFAIIFFLFIVVFVDIWIAYPTHHTATISSAGRTAYVTCTTALATLISTITASQIKTLWFWRLTRDGRKHVQIPTLLGIGKWRNHFRWWPISLSNTITGLMTTSIVAGIVPSQAPVSIKGSVIISPKDGDNGIYCTSTDNISVSGPWNWQLPDHTYLHIKPACLSTSCTPYCDYKDSVTLLSRLIPTDPIPQDFSSVNRSILPIYSISGNINVLPSALGVLLDFDVDRVPLGSVPKITDPSLWETASVCLPVFTSNPIKCSPLGNVSFNTQSITVNTPSCNVTALMNLQDPTFNSSSPAAASKICTGGPVGTSEIVMGATNHYANLLAEMMLNRSIPDENSTYSVSCEVNIPSTLEFREVHFNNHNLSVTSTSSCTPYSATLGGSLDPADIITPDKLAFASAGLLQLLSQNSWHDGSCDALFAAFLTRFPSPGLGNTNQTRQPFAFGDSTNFLEDLMGTATAMVWGEHLTTHVDYSTLLESSGTVRAWGIRVGSGRGWGVVYVIPQVWAGACLGVLFWGRSEKRGKWKMRSWRDGT